MKKSRKQIPINEYFDEMELSKDSKEERKEFANNLVTILVTLFSLMSLENNLNNDLDSSYYSSFLFNRYLTLLDSMGYTPSKALFEHIQTISSEIVNTTIDNIKDEYSLSNERTISIAETESNTVLNSIDFIRAVQNGYTKKVWHSIVDRVTRQSHKDIDNVTIPIEQPFELNGGLMMFPHDTSLGVDAREIVHCRCSVEYLK